MESPSFFLNQILAKVAEKRAISLHLTPGNLPTLRIDNRFEVLENENIISAEMLDKIIESNLDDNEKIILGNEKSVTTVKAFNNFRFKISVFYQKKMPSVTFYYIPDIIPSIEEIKFPSSLMRFFEKSSGMLIIAGSHQSGKTTTIASIIEEFNRNKNKRIVTLEDPIERFFVSKKCIIEQRQLGTDVKSIEEGLYYCLKEDVDIVFIGETKELMDDGLPLIMEIASGNSLVILELNAQSSISVMEKILNQLERKNSKEAGRHMLAEVLFGIIVQKLVPRRGGGMVLANEVAILNPTMQSLIREGKVYQIEGIIQTSRKEGMINLQRSLEELVEKGEVKQEDID
jgi:twitching motility protein PilT